MYSGTPLGAAKERGRHGGHSHRPRRRDVEVLQERVGRALPADRRRRPVAGQDDGGVVAGQDRVAQARHHLLGVAAGQVGAADRPGEQGVAREDHVDALLGGGGEDDRALGVAGGVVDAQGEPGELEGGAVVERPDLARLAQRQRPSEGRLGLRRKAPQRVGQHVPVRRVDPGGHVVAVAHGRHAVDVVDVPVGEQHRHRREPVLGEQRFEGLGGVLAGVDHDARLPRLRRHHVTVGLERPGRKTCD